MIHTYTVEKRVIKQTCDPAREEMKWVGTRVCNSRRKQEEEGSRDHGCCVSVTERFGGRRHNGEAANFASPTDIKGAGRGNSTALSYLVYIALCGVSQRRV